MQDLVVCSGTQQSGVKLRKMPLFGKQIAEDEIDFKYPSEEEFRNLLAMN